MPGTVLHALLIGVDHYLPHRLSQGGCYPDLRGAVADVNDVVCYLREVPEVPEERIQTLTSSATGGVLPPEPPSQWPTYDNMVRAFERLTGEARPGEQVFVYYSGHGGRTPTLIPEIKGIAAFDESLVPNDIGNPDEPYLRDVELTLLVKRMIEKGLYVTLVLDCCHSGGTLRDRVRGPAAVRGIDCIDLTERPQSRRVASPAELAQHWQALGRVKSIRTARPLASWLPHPERYVCLAACQPREKAYEYPFDGDRYRGALSHHLLEALRRHGPDIGVRRLFEHVLSKVSSQFRRQTPLVQGKPDQPFFRTHGRISPAARTVGSISGAAVIEVDEAGRRVRLQTGQAHGTHPGARFAVYAPGSRQGDEAPAEVVVTEIGAGTSWAEVVDPAAQPGLRVGGRAVLVHPGRTDRPRRKVALLPEERGAKDALEAVARALRRHRSGLPELEPPGGTPDFQVTVTGDHYQVLDRAGEPLPNLEPAVPVGKAEELVERLVHLAHYRIVEDLENHDQRAPRLEAELYPLPPDYDPERPEPVPGAVAAKVITVHPGDAVCLVIRNPVIDNPWQQALNVTALDLDPDWGIEQIHPSPEEAFYEPLDRGCDVWVALDASLTRRLQRGRDVLKVFAGTEPTAFHGLELPPLGGDERSPSRKGFSRAPETLLATLLGQRRRMRSGRSGLASRRWSVEHLEIHIVR